jgi:hypothetical protein
MILTHVDLIEKLLKYVSSFEKAPCVKLSGSTMSQCPEQRLTMVADTTRVNGNKQELRVGDGDGRASIPTFEK